MSHLSPSLKNEIIETLNKYILNSTYDKLSLSNVEFKNNNKNGSWYESIYFNQKPIIQEIITQEQNRRIRESLAI